MLVETGGEMTPEIEAALINIDSRTPDKIDAYAIIMERMDMESKYWKDKAKYMSAVGKACENVKEKLRSNIKYAMQELGKRELAGRDVRFVLSPSKPTLVIKEEFLDAKYFKTEVVKTPDKKAIEEALLLGEDVEGAMVVESYSLRQYANSKGESRE